ncbi:UPF0449 protein C19orf25 homolog [Calypte anna]|uniref:UPF0449 protein C19orf25 homolog n=1 Tax=Calypte anna TaxID=9244 RepID=UPI0011C45FD2|nr:UPF0449 protein C19orf25 homolog [Calypte anna]XP_030322320.1 UPF0449 protein C19orf25 homolog [Calypte anna]XP_030322321.1 UPF0449 protein C19orf25 homolog [Calypte anna]XP_030322322.1 UPF0449 protein C19orf25 homolog [Calypte anna]
MMSSKAKRVLSTRPEFPSLEQILSDVRGSPPTDPIFLLPEELCGDQGPSPGSPIPTEERERLFWQSRRYLEMNQRLRESREQLRERREELERVGAALEQSITQMRQKAL